jgi:hypothetical protein
MAERIASLHQAKVAQCVDYVLNLVQCDENITEDN